jgi:hypothetical protein
VKNLVFVIWNSASRADLIASPGRNGVQDANRRLR